MPTPPQLTDPPARRGAAYAAVAVSLALVGAAAWSSISAAARVDAVPAPAALAAAAATLQAELAAGDGIAFLPAWAAAERWRFEAAAREAGLDLAEVWVPADPLTAWDVEGLRRLWMLRMPALGAAADPEAIGRVVRQVALEGGVELALVELPESQIVEDLRAHLDQAEVSRVGDKAGATTKCTWNGTRHQCPGAWWTDVFVALNEVGSTRRRCIFAQPHPDGATLVVRWPTVRAARTLEGRVGNRLWAVRYDKGSDVAVRLRVAGEVRQELVLQRGDFGWHPLRVELTADDYGQPVSIEFAASDSAWRQLCFDLRLRGALPGGAP